MVVPTLVPVTNKPVRESCYTISEATGSIPPIYVNASVGITASDKVFIFGGFDKYEDEMDNNVKLLDLKTNTWVKRPSSTGSDHQTFAPSARSGHTAVVKGSTAIIFGGEKENQQLSNELFCYDIETDRWMEPEIEEEEDDDDDRGETKPVGRSRHAACLSEDGTKMVVSGGLAEGKQVLGDIWWFDFEYHEWKGPVEFVSRYDHTIAVYNNKIWAFGGLSIDMDRVSEVAWYDFDTNTIGKVHIQSLDYPLVGSSGIHFYGSGISGTMLDVVVPGSIPDVSTSIATLNMDSLNWRSIVEDCSEYFSGYTWYHMVASGSKLILLGQPNDFVGYDENLSHVLTIDLSEFGYFVSRTPSRSSSAYGGSQGLGQGTIGHDMYEFYKRSEMCDFEITAVDSDVRPPLEGSQNYQLSSPIKVHMTVLAARWPHFQRLIQSGMSETQSKRLFIPEPVKWVSSLIEYMYRDSIEGYDMDTVTGLLILANLYELPRLRKLCIESISKEGVTTNTAVLVWERATIADEKIIRRNAALYCFRHWGAVVRTSGFEQLSKHALLMLCNEADERSLITTTRNSPHRYSGNSDQEEDFDEDDDKDMDEWDEDE